MGGERRRSASREGCGYSLTQTLFWVFLAGLAHQISDMINVSVGLDLILQCLPKHGLEQHS